MSENKTPTPRTDKVRDLLEENPRLSEADKIITALIACGELEQELQSAQATIHELQFGKYGTQHLGERIRTMEAEKISAQKSEQDCRQIITTYCEEIDGQRLQINQLKAEIGRLREALGRANRIAKAITQTDGCIGPIYDRAKAIADYSDKALSTQPAGETFVPCVWDSQEGTGPYDTGCRNSFYFEDNQSLQDIPDFKFCPYCGKPIQDASYTPKSEVKGCKYCLKDECECSDADTTTNIGDK